jgi:hypothetical protein
VSVLASIAITLDSFWSRWLSPVLDLLIASLQKLSSYAFSESFQTSAILAAARAAT